MDRALAVPSSGNSRDRKCIFVDFASPFIDNTVLGSGSGDGSRHAGSNTAIERFWRCQFAEMTLFCGVRCECYVQSLVCVMCGV